MKQLRSNQHYCKSAHWVWMRNEIKGSYDKSLSPKYQAIPEKISRVCCHCHCFTRNNANGNKLVIFPNIALYYGDTYIIVQVCVIFNCAMEVLHSTVNLTKKWYKYYTSLHKLSMFNKSNYDVLYSTVYLIRKVQLKPGEIMVPELLKMKKLQWSMSPSCSAASVSQVTYCHHNNTCSLHLDPYILSQGGNAWRLNCQ